MRYRVLVDANGKPMRRREGYYVAASNGQSGIMSKRWVVENIDKFTNLRLCRKVLYLVQDVYENASEAIINNILADMRSANGLNVIADATLYGFKQSMHEEAETREPKGNLCPAKSSTSNIFTNAHVSAFRLNDKSDSAKAAGKGSGYMGTFFGIDAFMPDVENMFYTRPFYIPNANVQDLT